MLSIRLYFFQGFTDPYFPLSASFQSVCLPLPLSLLLWYGAYSRWELGRMRARKWIFLSGRETFWTCFFLFHGSSEASPLRQKLWFWIPLLKGTIKSSFHKVLWDAGEMKSQVILVLEEIVNYPSSKTAFAILLCNGLVCVSWERGSKLITYHLS